ncbi:hypothetical protein [Anaerorhabdus sp.]|uniref:hypothetical protein n=1 Tax=Anaerorhabdus sp. TaxID=1872524 RepID=UPI002B1EDDC1|nr:hypothetical protein [Anaerorhabdus sp.]MEA4875515.1 hypothetical protein [Anaerorhabdus sp.]
MDRITFIGIVLLIISVGIQYYLQKKRTNTSAPNKIMPIVFITISLFITVYPLFIDGVIATGAELSIKYKDVFSSESILSAVTTLSICLIPMIFGTIGYIIRRFIFREE